ncbi:hypothetical protein [Salinactinospora qingdaonensis]|uniref:hypothetical protein n=1 Tax=Salinactinospora qingdaonensis TaxID=702744 RepID=UPI0031EE9B4A
MLVTVPLAGLATVEELLSGTGTYKPGFGLESDLDRINGLLKADQRIAGIPGGVAGEGKLPRFGPGGQGLDR